MAKGEKIVQGSQAIVPQNEYIEVFKEGYVNGFNQGYTDGYKQGQIQGFSQVAAQNYNQNLQLVNPGPGYQTIYPPRQQ